MARSLTGLVIGPRPYACSYAGSGDRRAPRPRRLLRRGGAAGEPGAEDEAAGRRRRSARPRRRRDGELRGAGLRDPLGDELRRGVPALPGGRLRPTAPLALPDVLAGRLGGGARGRPHGRADRDRRGLPRRRRGRARLPAGAADRGGGAVGGARRDEPDVLAGRRVLQGRRQDRERPPQARRPNRRAGRTRGVVPRAVRRAQAAGRRSEGRGAAAPGRRDDDRRARRARRRSPRASTMRRRSATSRAGSSTAPCGTDPARSASSA